MGFLKGRQTFSFLFLPSLEGKLPTDNPEYVIQQQGHHSHHEAKVFWGPWDLIKSRVSGWFGVGVPCSPGSSHTSSHAHGRK